MIFSLSHTPFQLRLASVWRSRVSLGITSGSDFFDCNEGADTVTDFDDGEDTANANCEVLQ